jgi:branched-subunit amino acid transport protein
MSQSTIWIILLVATVATFLFRYSFLWLAGYRQMPERLEHVLRFIPPAVLSAMTFPAILTPAVETADWHAPRLLAGILALIVMWKTRKSLQTLIWGMASLWLLRWLAV